MKKFLCAFIAILFGIASYSQTPVPGGSISGTWDTVGSPYLIQGETTIDSGTTLTIEAGVMVEWQNDFSSMFVQGQILAIGTEADSIVFTAEDPLTGWKGIRFENTPTGNDTSEFVYCTFKFARAHGPYPDNCGGAIAALNFGKIIFDHCYFYDNKAITAANIGGGAIALWTSSPVIRNSTFINNRSSAGGAIICWQESLAIIENNLFTNNRGVWGGAIYCYDSNPLIDHNLFYENTGTVRGGAIDLWINCSPTIINNTIVDNDSYDIGGGISLYEECSPTIRNTILWGNTADEGNQVYIWTEGDIPDFFYCDIQGGQDSIGGVPHTGEYKQCIDSIPMFEDPLAGNYHLLGSSPCIDAGDPNSPPDPDGSPCDIGAFYFHQIGYGYPESSIQYPVSSIECYPNPTQGKSEIRYQISEIRNVVLIVYGVHGKEISVLVNESQLAGEYTVRFDASELPDGLYMIRLQAGNESAVGKLLVVH
jgi:hypothetical protein